MGSWYALPLGDAVTAPEECERVRRAFEAACPPPAPTATAVFVGTESSGDLHCDVTAYFSPAAANTARELGARPCNPPARDQLELLAGEEDSWRALFD